MSDLARRGPPGARSVDGAGDQSHGVAAARWMRWWLGGVFLVIWSVVAGASAWGQPGDAGQIARDRAAIEAYVHAQRGVRSVASVALRPDGRVVAWSAEDGSGANRVYVRAVGGAAATSTVISAATPGSTKSCYEGEPQWSPSGAELAFVSDCQKSGQLEVYVSRVGARLEAGPAERLTSVTGSVRGLRWSPDGLNLAFLFVRDATRAPSPMSAEARAVGVIDERVNHDIMRVAVVSRAGGEVREITPAGMYTFEFDWSPDSREMAYVAAAPPGDDNWYVAKLYRVGAEGGGESRLVYTPKDQIALPRWSPDGRQIAFVEGLMSDEGGTGGEICEVPAEGGARRDLTPGRASTPSWFSWRADGRIVMTEFVGGDVAIAVLEPATGNVTRLWQGGVTIHATGEETSLSVAGEGAELQVAMYRYGWGELPEVWVGPPAKLRAVTELNAGVKLALPRAESMEWESDGRKVQGWLLYPTGYEAGRRYPLLVMVHGGPAWIAQPMWEAPDFNTTVFTQLGYFVFFPNARGSYGQGEAFTGANRRDWGFGDLQDMLRGVDAAVAKVPVDGDRVGLLGWSYGGSVAMFAGTQTGRFRALVAGAGAADWLSYYGQNSIDQWMRSYFGKSPYEDPAAYARVSAMTYITRTRTPTLVLVGERDGEAPPAQSFQFWHALKERGVPTRLVVYPDEGHDFWKAEDRVDVTLRTLEWFREYMPEAK